MASYAINDALLIQGTSNRQSSLIPSHPPPPPPPPPLPGSHLSTPLCKYPSLSFSSSAIAHQPLILRHSRSLPPPCASEFAITVNRVMASPPSVVQQRGPLMVMIAGAPASGKGTQCELITEKYGLVHVAAGDLLREEIAAGSETGKQAKAYMEIGQLVPDEIVVTMVKERLLKPDAVEKGWLLDGYPRSLSQAVALKELGFQPDVFILLDVPEDLLVERVVGRRLDPVTGRIYHLKYSPPENEEIATRLTQRFDDTEEKVKLRLQTHHQNVEAVLSMYKDIIVKVDGSGRKEVVFTQIDNSLSRHLEQKTAPPGTVAA